jgi:hypothetical protein
MESRLLCAIDAAVERALPDDWPRVPSRRLPRHGGAGVRHAFRREVGRGPGSYLAIAVAPPFVTRPRTVLRDLTALVDDVLGRGAGLLLLYAPEDDPDSWIQDQVDYPHPRFLSLPCRFDPDGAGDSCTVDPTGGGADPLADAIFDLWRDALFYVGPEEGMQTVGVEVMRDECWHCYLALGTVTGLVFPDRPVADWAAPDWAYFGQPLDLAAIPDSLIPALSAAVDGWRAAGETDLTVIRWRYSKAVRQSYWAAECPACGAFQGAFPTMEARLQLLHDLDSRTNGTLSYRPLALDVPRQALRALGAGFEFSPHACPLGWFRADSPDLADPPPPGGPVAKIDAVAEPVAPGPSPGPPELHPSPGPRQSPDLAAKHPSALVPLHAAAAVPTCDAAPTCRPGTEEIAQAGLVERGSHAQPRRLGQILLSWRGRRRI